MNHLAVTLLLALFTYPVLVSPPFAADPTPAPVARVLPADPDLSGYYACTGSQGGKSYAGVVLIQKRHGLYLVQWTVAGASYLGVGHVVPGVGGGPEQLCVGWASDDGKFRGGNLYRIGRGKTPTLSGTWASIPGDGQQHAERLEFLRPAPAAPAEE